MSAIQRFEDIESWKKGRELTRRVYVHSDSGRFARDFGLRDQMQRASVSIMSNIAEGFERDGNKEFRQYLYVPRARQASFGPSSTWRSMLGISTKPFSMNSLQRLSMPSDCSTASFAIWIVAT